jgi:hypothetical protein
MPWEQLTCDACGQAADQEHIARRLKRLESMTRYRPIHVQALFLGGVSPAADGDYLYSAEGEFHGEGLALLLALGIDPAGKPVEVVLADFQRRGYLLSHVVECPSQLHDSSSLHSLLQKRIATMAARIRRSLKPKKLIPIDGALDPLAEVLGTELADVDIVLPEKGSVFRPNELAAGSLATALSATAAASL